MKSYKTAIGFLRHLAFLAKDQEMMDCTDWDKLTDEEQQLFYAILAGIQNDLGDMQSLFEKSGKNITIWNG